MSTKAQVWTTDFFLSLLILTVLLVIFGRSMINITTSTGEDVSPLVFEGRAISDSLLSEGYPVDWNTSSVSKIGVVSNGRINASKMVSLYSMDYQDAKLVFNSPFDFFVFILGEDGKLVSVSGVYGFGNPFINATHDGVEFSGLNPDRIVKITRISVYDSKIVNLVVYLWD